MPYPGVIFFLPSFARENFVLLLGRAERKRRSISSDFMKTFQAPFLFIFSILSIFLLFPSCSSDTRSANDRSIPEMEFAVDKTLLGDVFRDSALQVEFHPPARWIKADPRTKEMMAVVIDSLNPYPLRIKEVFYDSTSQSMALLSDLSGARVETRDKIIGDYEQVFNAGKMWNDVKMATFRFNDLTTDQLLLQNQQMVNFKLIFFKNRDIPFQVDYIVPRQTYAEKVRYIESSIGSIRRIKK